MCQCHAYASCHSCSRSIDRRRFFHHGGVALAAAGSLSPIAHAASADERRKIRVAAVFLAQVRNSWPYPGFDAAGRQREILAALRQGAPQMEFVPVTIKTPGEAGKALALREQVDGYLVYVTTLSWALRGVLAAIGKLNKPTVVADEFLGGSGAFLTGVPPLVRGGAGVAMSTTRLDDLVAVARQFGSLDTPGFTTADFVRRCEDAYRRTFPPADEIECADDPLKLTDISECVARFRKSRVLVLGKGHGGQQRDVLGATWHCIDWKELESVYPDVDLGEAAEWATRWTNEATALPPGEYVEPSGPAGQGGQKCRDCLPGNAPPAEEVRYRHDHHELRRRIGHRRRTERVSLPGFRAASRRRRAGHLRSPCRRHPAHADGPPAYRASWLRVRPCD